MLTEKRKVINNYSMKQYIVVEYIPAHNHIRANNMLTVYSTSEAILQRQLDKGMILDYKPYSDGISYSIVDNKVIANG